MSWGRSRVGWDWHLVWGPSEDIRERGPFSFRIYFSPDPYAHVCLLFQWMLAFNRVMCDWHPWCRSPELQLMCSRVEPLKSLGISVTTVVNTTELILGSAVTRDALTRQYWPSMLGWQLWCYNMLQTIDGLVDGTVRRTTCGNDFLFILEQIIQFTLLSNGVSKRHCLWILSTDILRISFDLGNAFPWRRYGTENSFWEKSLLVFVTLSLRASCLSVFVYWFVFMLFCPQRLQALRGSYAQSVKICCTLKNTYSQSLSLSFMTWSWIDTVTASVWNAPPSGSYFGCLFISPDDGALLGYLMEILCSRTWLVKVDH